VQDKTGGARDFFASGTHGYILFPNVVQGRVVDLQGRAYPTPARRSAYFNRPGAIRHLYNAGDAGQRLVTVASYCPPGDSLWDCPLEVPGAGNPLPTCFFNLGRKWNAHPSSRVATHLKRARTDPIVHGSLMEAEPLSKLTDGQCPGGRLEEWHRNVVHVAYPVNCAHVKRTPSNTGESRGMQRCDDFLIGMRAHPADEFHGCGGDSARGRGRMRRAMDHKFLTCAGAPANPHVNRCAPGRPPERDIGNERADYTFPISGRGGWGVPERGNITRQGFQCCTR